MSRHPNSRLVGNHRGPKVHATLNRHDVRKLETAKGFDIKTKSINGQKVHVDVNDVRPHTIHKYKYHHKGVKKTGFFKSFYGGVREIYRHHLENKEKRTRIREEEARAAVDESAAKANIIRAKGEAKRNQELGYAEIQRAKGEKYERIGAGVRQAEEGFGDAARETGEGVRRAERGIGEAVGEGVRAAGGDDDNRHWWNRD